MPIYPDPVGRLIIANQDKTREVLVQFPPDMKNGELKDKLTEITEALNKSIAKEIEEEVKAKAEKEKAEKEKAGSEKKEGEKNKIEKMPEPTDQAKK